MSVDPHSPQNDTRDDTDTDTDTDSDDSDSTALTRRQFLAGVTTATAITATPSVVSDPATATPFDSGSDSDSRPELDSPDETDLGEPPYGDAEISRDGIRTLASHEYNQKKKGNTINYDKKVDAVEDLGCDPNGNEPIQQKIMDAAEDGMLIIFPPGVYLITSDIIISIEGTFGIVGQGFKKSKKPPKPGKNSVVFKIRGGKHTFSAIKGVAPLKRGQFGNFVIDGRESNTYAGVMLRSGGNVRARDIRVLGANHVVHGPDEQPAAFSPFAETGDSLLVMERCIARGGGIPGSKNIGGTHGFGIFGRDGKRGTIILKDAVIENWADNGIYGARTGAEVHVLGGLYKNNDVSQVRINGAATCEGVDIVIDEQNYTGLKSKSNADEQGAGWPATNGLKIETKKKIPGSWETGTPVKNCNIVGNSVAENGGVLGSLIHVWDSGGAVTVDNCRITNNIEETTSIIAEQPGSGHWAAAPKPWTLTVKNSVIKGKGAGGPAIKTSGRPRSIVKSTCFAYPDASQSDIRGPSVSDCGFGKQCKSAGLKNPKKLGSSPDVGSVPLNASGAGANSSAGAGGRQQQGPSKGVLVSVVDGMLLMVLMLVGMIAVFVGGILAAFGAVAGLLGGD